MERGQIQARRPGQAPSFRRSDSLRASRVQPVIGFVGVQQQQQASKVRKDSTAVQHNLLAERASQWLHLINTQQLRAFDTLVAEDATLHDDGMWLLQPAKGRSAIRNVWRDWLRATPDYRMELVSVATEPATNDVFVMWRATGMSRLSLIPHRTPTNKPFEHTGVTRLQFDPATGHIKDQWTWRGATADEGAWLLSRSHKSFDAEAFIAGDAGSVTTGTANVTLSASSSNGSNGNGSGIEIEAGRARAKGAALAFREAFGAVPGADVSNLTAALSDDYQCKEGTGVFRAVNLASRDACINYCVNRQEQLAGSPYWHSEAMSPDGKLLFVHFQNVLMNKDSRTLMGLSSGILVHAFDDDHKIRRSVMFRGPMSFSERAQFFAMDCRAHGERQAEKLGVDESLFGGM